MRFVDRYSEPFFESFIKNQIPLENECCCSQLFYYISENDIPFIYISQFREYGVKVFNGENKSYQETFQLLHFCASCGDKLPFSLREVWFDEIEKIGIDPHEDEEKIPDEFKSDEWWKKRGL